MTALGIGVALLAAACSPMEPGSQGPPTAPTPGEVVLGGARDRTESRSADDWVSHADHVLVVTVMNEVRENVSQDELDRGEALVHRTVELSVDKVLWSAPGAARPAPATVTQPAPGWLLRDGHETVFGLENSSRLNVGHTYVKALEWIDDPCSDDPRQGKWARLGAGDVIPFDSDVLGAGEFEGRILSQREAESIFTKEPGGAGLRGQLVGLPATAVADRLVAAQPYHEYGGGAAECDRSTSRRPTTSTA